MPVRENSETARQKFENCPVSGSEWMQKARELRASLPILGRSSRETRLDGCARSLQRTRL